jgi:hypothetical protein
VLELNSIVVLLIASVGVLLMVIAIILYLAVLPIIRPRPKYKYEPMEFSDVRKTTIYSDHVKNGEL